MQERFIEWLKKEMVRRGWSIRELARHSDMTHAYIANVLRGEKPLTVNFCFSMANALNEPVWKLLLLAGFVEDVPPEVKEDQELRLVMTMFNKLSVSSRKEAISYLNWLASREDSST
jgi:transcriptional regulator with XRE-family HTH domain